MRPVKGSQIIKIPVTFDIMSKGVTLSVTTFLWVGLIFILWLFITIVSLIVSESWGKLGVPVITFIFFSLIVRYFLLRENYFKKKRRELIDKGFLFDPSTLWSIIDISEAFPYFVQYANGVKGLFVMFDKGIIIGKPDDNNYYHHEAIAEAYRQMAKRGMECMHIDYMDYVGKDSRIEGLFDMASKVSNEDLRKLLTVVFSYIEDFMNTDYASYDVYVFYFIGSEEVFWSELQEVLRYFKQANYRKYKVLNKEEIGDLVVSLFNLNEFSAKHACENLFKEEETTSFIRPIWTERDGVKTVINKTMEEIEEMKRVAETEKKVKKANKRKLRGRKRNKKTDEENIDLFG